MKLILVLAALLIVGLLVTQQLNKGEEAGIEQDTAMEAGDPPEVPTNPGDVPKFEEDMNKFMENEAARQAEEIDRATQ